MKPGEINKLTIKQKLETIFGVERVQMEYRFHPVRRWRFDYAVPEIKLAVEYQGHAGFIGKGGASGHSSITGLTGDCEKMNSAQAHGWRVLSFTALHFRYNDRAKHKLTEVGESIMNLLAGMQRERDELESLTK
jgi:very-short-patch-repair endonuclease